VRCVSIDILRALSRHDEAAAMAKEVLALRAQQSSASEGDAPDEQMVLPGFDEAEAMFKTVLDRHPKNLGALAGLGHLARRRGDREGMQKYYMAALALEPTNISLRVEVARAFKEQGDVALARQILETVLTEHGDRKAPANPL
jgi:predicted Zn-dependent protease